MMKSKAQMRAIMLSQHKTAHIGIDDKRWQEVTREVTRAILELIDSLLDCACDDEKVIDYGDISVALFESIEHEPPTSDAIAKLSALGIKVYLPVWKSGDGDTVYRWRLFDKGSYQLINALPEDVDMIIVPAICVDRAGNRLGRGGGWYDRVLANIKKTTKVYALCYTYSILDSGTFETDDHDVTMNGVIEISLPDKCLCANRL